VSDKVIISVATTGSWPTKAQNPYVPIREEEIAAAAVECRAAGAAIVHVHVRDEGGRVTCDPRRYARVRALIEAAGCDAIVNMSTGGGAGLVTDEERMAPVALAPEIASFDCGSLNFGDGVFVNSPAFLEELAERMRRHNVLPEIECFEPGHVWNALRLIEAGKLRPPFWFQFVLGVRGGSPATVKQLVNMVEMLPPGANWSVCAIARAQLPMNVAALAMGGHVRTGLEDNLYYRKGEPATNAQLVARLARIAEEVGRPIATPDEAREIIGLDPLPPVAPTLGTDLSSRATQPLRDPAERGVTTQTQPLRLPSSDS
jgi:3-keto-5-aminohexanoate cleavage enzyme